MEGANDFTVSFDGKKMLYSKGRRENKKWFISSATARHAVKAARQQPSRKRHWL